MATTVTKARDFRAATARPGARAGVALVLALLVASSGLAAIHPIVTAPPAPASAHRCDESHHIHAAPGWDAHDTDGCLVCQGSVLPTTAATPVGDAVATAGAASRVRRAATTAPARPPPAAFLSRAPPARA